MGDLMEAFKQEKAETEQPKSLMDGFKAEVAKKQAIIEKPVAVPEPNAAARMGRGFMDVGQGLKQLYLQITDPNAATAYTRKVDKEIGLYEKGRQQAFARAQMADKTSANYGPAVPNQDQPGKEGMTHYPFQGGPGFDWMRMGGNVAATYPLAYLPGAQSSSLAVRTGAGAAQGGVAGGSLFTPEGGSKIGQTLAGVFGGAAVPQLVNAASKGGSTVVGGTRRLPGRIAGNINIKEKLRLALKNEGIDLNQVEQSMVSRLTNAAKAQLKVNGDLDAPSLARMTRANEFGFVDDYAPTTGQVTRSPKQWARERNLSKVDDVGDDLTGRFENQNRKLIDLEDDMPARGGGANSDYEAGESIYEAVKAKWQSTQKEVGALYKRIRNEYGDLDGIEPKSLTSSLDDLSDDATSMDIAQSVKNRLKRYGVIDDEGQATGKSLTVEQAESLRKWTNKLSDKNDPNLQRVKREVINSLDDDVFESVGDDVFSEARAAARNRFKDFETKVLNQIVDKDAAPDSLFRKVLKGDVRDITGLKKNLLDNEAGQQAWENVRKRTISHLWDKATAGKGQDGVFSGAAFKKALDAIGDARLKVLFSPEELSRMKGVSQVGLDLTYTPPYSAVNWSNTTPALFNLMRQGRVLPLIGDAMEQASKKGASMIEVERALSGSPVDVAASRGVDKVRQQMVNQWLADKLKVLPSGVGTQSYGLLGELPASFE